MSENYPDMDSYETLNLIRNISNGDRVKVYYQKGRFVSVKNVELSVYDVSQGRNPLLSCWESNIEDTENAHPSKHYHMEYSEIESIYKLRNLSGLSEVDGSKIVAIEYI